MSQQAGQQAISPLSCAVRPSPVDLPEGNFRMGRHPLDNVAPQDHIRELAFITGQCSE